MGALEKSCLHDILLLGVGELNISSVSGFEKQYGFFSEDFCDDLQVKIKS